MLHSTWKPGEKEQKKTGVLLTASTGWERRQKSLASAEAALKILQNVSCQLAKEHGKGAHIECVIGCLCLIEIPLAWPRGIRATLAILLLQSWPNLAASHCFGRQRRNGKSSQWNQLMRSKTVSFGVEHHLNRI